jgi:hypothetical protein
MSGTRGHEDIRLVVQTWLGSRLVIAMVAAWVAFTEHRRLSDQLGAWDVAHFLTIAREGYTNHDLIAFFPGWPLLIRLASSVPGTVPVLMGTGMALVASGFAAAALYRIGGAPAAITWLLAPAAVFTMVPYSEAAFCAAAFWAWERARAKHWTAAAVLAAVAMSMRVSGVFLIAALAILALTQAGSQKAKWARVARLTFPAAVLGAYLLYLRLSLGSWTVWYDTQAKGWSRQFTWPWEALQHTIDAAMPGGYVDAMGWAEMFRFELVSVAVGVLITVIMLFRKRWGESAWVGLQVLAFSFSYWFMSVNRAVLLWFPLWDVLGNGLAKGRGRRKLTPARVTLNWALAVLALAVQAWWAWRFFTGQWSS